MLLCRGPEEDLAVFLQALQFCIEKYLHFEGEPRFTYDELRQKLNLSELSATRTLLLLQFEPRILNGMGSGSGQPTFYQISNEILRFRKVRTIEQYLEKRDQYKKSLPAEIAQIVEPNTENDQQRSIVGDIDGKKRVKSSSTWDDLITELQRLNAIAVKIQNYENGQPKLELSMDEYGQFFNDYLDWYSDCLVALPDEMKDKFRAEYENTAYYFITKAHFRCPTGDEHGSEMFLYHYGEWFYDAYVSHKLMLLEASKRPLKPERISTVFEAVNAVVLIARRFGLIARTLEQRRNGQEPLIIANEYDAQYLFKGLLKLFFDDVRPEEWTPSYAGKSTRIDFLLKSEQIVVELKMTREGLKTASQVGEELIIDIHHYRFHRNCKTLVAFVYDPNRFISEPKSLENDLSQTIDGMPVKVIVTQG